MPAPWKKKTFFVKEISDLSPNFVTTLVITFGDEKNYKTVQVFKKTQKVAGSNIQKNIYHEARSKDKSILSKVDFYKFLYLNK